LERTRVETARSGQIPTTFASFLLLSICFPVKTLGALPPVPQSAAVAGRNDTAGAANVYRELVRRDPNFAEAHNNLGLVLLQSGDIRGAQAEFIEAVRLKPRYAEAHYNLALALYQDGKEEESRAEFDKAFEMAPELRNLPRP
jgi:tetratricopeptide (TPR) repeat protein